ncbi:MAG: metallophosphoesterase [Ignavibacteriota bacterium]
MKFTKLFLSLILAASILSSCKSDSTDSNNNPNPDSVMYSFVVLGCNRVDKADTNTTTNPSTANLAQFNRTMDEVAVLSPKPSFLFFAGDMIMGYSPDSNVMANQLKAWKALYEASAVKAAGITLIPIPGNHESQNDKKVAYSAAERNWLNVMAPYFTFAGNGPSANPTGPDSLLTDQSKLNYSFNFKDAHFVVVNTDPVGRDWRPPSNWIASDVASAHASSSVKHIFAIGHKPAYEWDFDAAAGGKDGMVAYPANRDIFWNALENNNAEAMFCAHNHVYRAFRPHNKTWMIVSGDAGSKLESGVTAAQQMYGFTVVQVLQDGRVIEKHYGRDIPAAGYMAPCPASTYPTTIRDSNLISWK